MDETAPDRLNWRQIDARTRELLYRMNEEEREAIIFVLNLDPDQRANIRWMADLPENVRKELDRFGHMSPDQREAGYTVVKTIVNMRWLLRVGKMGIAVLVTISGGLLALTQILKLMGKGG